MERMTKRDEERNADYYLYGLGAFDKVEALEECVDHLAAYEDAMPLERVQELAQAEKDGRLVVLPCKAGDYVWVDGRRAIVTEFFGYKTERYLRARFYDNIQYIDIDIPFEEIGKTVFLTHEEAEAALKR